MLDTSQAPHNNEPNAPFDSPGLEICTFAQPEAWKSAHRARDCCNPWHACSRSAVVCRTAPSHRQPTVLGRGFLGPLPFPPLIFETTGAASTSLALPPSSVVGRWRWDAVGDGSGGAASRFAPHGNDHHVAPWQWGSHSPPPSRVPSTARGRRTDWSRSHRRSIDR